MRIPFLTLLLLSLSLTAGAQSSSGAIESGGAIEIEEDGRLWIEGSASVVDYTCQAEKLAGNGMIENTENPQQNVQGEGNVAVTVRVPVQALECGKRKMNRDMYKALKADKFEYISYRLLEAELAKEPKNDSLLAESGSSEEEWMNIRTRGILKIAGTSDTTEVLVQGKLLDDRRFRVRGKNAIDMKTYDVKPPTAMFGLIKADNMLTVYFDVTVRLKESVALLFAEN